MNELQTLISGNVYVFLAVFTRVGFAFMMMPGLGDQVIPERIRLFIALGFSLVITPAIVPLMGTAPSSPALLILFLCRETLIGVFLGIVARTLLTSLNTAGMVISYKMSLANASMFNPQMSEQSSIVSALLTMAAVVLIFATNMHHMMIAAVYNSYEKFPPTGDIVLNDIVVAVAETVNTSFIIAMEFSAPFIIISFALQVSLGVIARLIPQIQVFFLGIPVQVIVGLATLTTTISICLYYFLDRFENYYTTLFG